MDVYAKAITSIIVGGIAWVVAKFFGLEVPPDLFAALQGAITGFFVWLIPNAR